MKRYDVNCPNCGRMNRNLYLEETEGWMECESCGCISRVSRSARERACVSFPGLPERRLMPAGMRRGA